MMYAYTEQFVLPLSHDEVVHGKGSMINKMPGDTWQKFANLRAYYAFMWGHPGKQLLFMGGEFGQWQEWSEQRSLDWWLLDGSDHSGLLRCMGDMNRAYRDNAALWRLDHDPAGFEWIDANDAAGNVFSWLRFDGSGGWSPASRTWLRSSAPTTSWGCRRRASGARSSTPMRRSTAAPGSATWAGSRPPTSRGTGDPRPPGSCFPACDGVVARLMPGARQPRVVQAIMPSMFCLSTSPAVASAPLVMARYFNEFMSDFSGADDNA